MTCIRYKQHKGIDDFKSSKFCDIKIPSGEIFKKLNQSRERIFKVSQWASGKIRSLARKWGGHSNETTRIKASCHSR